ncbi:MAG: NAD-glutamate dehydrogenase, partial [Chloracidobacterium sp.]|nr:NAD-glutamate dehydrogenase [Chloracidobacterium sp.]
MVVEETAERIDEILDLARAKAAPEKRDAIERFVNAYFQETPPEDLMERRVDDLYGAALSHWNYARKREHDKPKLRVFNPTVEEHGWQSTHTVIEIVNDDMPFLVDSVTMEVNRHGLTLHLIIHPIMMASRRDGGELEEMPASPVEGAIPESLMHVEVDRIVSAEKLAALTADLTRVLGDVRRAVTDWKKMQAKVDEALKEIDETHPPLAPDELHEGKAFLRWLSDNHFTFLGYRCYDLTGDEGEEALRVVPDSGLGILREGNGKSSASALPSNLRAFARLPRLLYITKANSRSTVHRPGYLDYIGVKRFDERGEVCGEHRFLGLFTSTAYSAKPSEIPLLRRKTANVIS